MIEATVISAAEEADLLKEWFETVHFDVESEGIPELLPERDDEESRAIEHASLLAEWLYRGATGEPPIVDSGAWDYIDFDQLGMNEATARSIYDSELSFHLLFLRGNPNHSKKNGQFVKGGGGSASPKGLSNTSPVRGTDQSKWAEDVSRDMEHDPLSYGDNALSTPVPRPLVAIAHKQGFDGMPQKGSVDDVVKAGGTEIHRGIIPHEKTGTSAETIKDRMTNGAYEPGKGIYGNGYYFSTSPGIAKMYANAPVSQKGYNAKPVSGGLTVRAALHKDAKIVNYQDIQKEYNEWRAARKDRVHWNTFETKFQIPEGKVSPALLDQVADPGHFAALKGYDAIRVPLADRPVDRKNKARIKKKIGSDDLGDEIVVLNRTALVVDDGT